jgi:hypothetical protein
MHPGKVWLRFNPSGDWAETIGDKSLEALKVFGYRHVWNEKAMRQWPLIMYGEDDNKNYFQDETHCEEGWATENQVCSNSPPSGYVVCPGFQVTVVGTFFCCQKNLRLTVVLTLDEYWGGAPVHMNKGSFLPDTRFTEDLVTMCTFDTWPPVTSRRVYKLMPFKVIQRVLTQHFWQYDIGKWGHEAMKIWPLAPPRVFCNWSKFKWDEVEYRFGWAARRWLQYVDMRLKYDYEHAVLWAWLRQLTRLALEPRLVMLRWHNQQKVWEKTDKSLWVLRNDCSEKVDIVMGYLRRLREEAHTEPPMPGPAPPIHLTPFRNAFAAMSNIQRVLSQEASFYQLITVDYHRQLDPSTKRDIQNFYASRLRDRLDGIHLRTAADCLAFLDMLRNIDPIILHRVTLNDEAMDLFYTAQLELREKFLAVQHAFRPVRQTFSEDPGAYVYNFQDFANVAPFNAIDTTKRIEKMAKKQLRALSGSLLTIAQGWVQILENGERLANAKEWSPEGEMNRKLAAVVQYIDELQSAHEQQVTAQNPRAPELVQRLSQARWADLLQEDQGAPDPTRGRMAQRFKTAAPQQGHINPWQAVYAEASGFVPYQDPRTGFTQFHSVNIPTESSPSVNPVAAAMAQAQGESLVRTFAPGGGNVQAPSGGQPRGPVDHEANLRGLLQGLSDSPPQPHPRHGGQPALNAISALLGERGRQHEANPELAGHVVPSIYNRALQTVAGPGGAALTPHNVPGANKLFGTSAAQISVAHQQLEDIIRKQELGANPDATQGGMPRQGPGVGVAPPSQAYEPVGGNPSQVFPPQGTQN